MTMLAGTWIATAIARRGGDSGRRVASRMTTGDSSVHSSQSISEIARTLGHVNWRPLYQ